jgi:predicted small metal-binding protein
MSKKVECHKVNPATDCDHVVRGRDEEEVMANAEEHARDHGLEPTPELMDQVRSYIEDEPERA